MKFFSLDELKARSFRQPQPKDWTVVIPAAGRGSRLGYDKPKILFPIAGRTILDRLISLLAPQAERFIFVLSPEGAKHVQPILETQLAERFTVAIQPEPLGMAHAIYQAVPKLATPHTLIIWGDQVAIRPQTIESIMKIHRTSPKTKLTMPIVRREEPYVHYQRDVSNRFVRVLERREGARMPAVGESDCGLFAVDTNRLQQLFAAEISRGITYSQGTKEWNFLPMLPQFETGGESVSALRLESLEETIGVNDAADVARLEQYFRQEGL